MELDPSRWYTLHNIGELQVLAPSEGGILPTKDTARDGTYTLFSPYDLEVPAGRTKSVSTDLFVGDKKLKKLFF